jgi:hypothetical protein
MDGTVNSWFRPPATELAFWNDPRTRTLTWSEWKSRFVWERDPATLPVPGCPVYRSFTTLDATQLPAPAGFELVEPWSSPPFHLAWIHLPERVVLTNTEGELRCLIGETHVAWNQALRELNALYHQP